MKLIEWKISDEIEAYTTTRYDEDQLFNIGFNDRNNEEVLNNRKKLAKYLNTDLDHMVAPQQRHTTNFKEVTLKDGGKGMYCKEDAIENTDALYTRDPDLYLITFHADCCPVLLYCKDQKIVAAIHSGWRGTVNEIVAKVSSHLITNENCNPKEIYAYIGPSIEQRNFEAMDDIIDLVKQMSFDTSSYYKIKDEKHYLLDSKGLIKKQLLQSGIPEGHITISPYCTIEDEDLFFSYRREKGNNRNMTIIKRKEL